MAVGALNAKRSKSDREAQYRPEHRCHGHGQEERHDHRIDHVRFASATGTLYVVYVLRLWGWLISMTLWRIL